MFKVSQDVIDAMQPAVEKLVATLKKKGITIQLTDGDLANVVIKFNDKTARVAHWVFYRMSGVCKSYKHDENSPIIEILDVSDEAFMLNVMRPCIELLVGTMEMKQK